MLGMRTLQCRCQMFRRRMVPAGRGALHFPTGMVGCVAVQRLELRLSEGREGGGGKERDGRV